ncbi:hypothetical protein OPV22_015823 [Ensete ventricosum]|uniref:Uncharacterized protein n=1 Tax=Ensete ventricosum TaxID=4639 RepID=A0AAV8RBA4_ENSVE|nr:hypothetical protein OPV22_015823 [Ensete ventricosum]
MSSATPSANGTATAPKPPFSAKRYSGRPTESDLSSPTTSIRYICFATAPNAIDLFAELPSKFYETFAAHFTKRACCDQEGGSGCHLSPGVAARCSG